MKYAELRTPSMFLKRWVIGLILRVNHFLSELGAEGRGIRSGTGDFHERTPFEVCL